MGWENLESNFGGGLGSIIECEESDLEDMDNLNFLVHPQYKEY